MAEYIQMTLNEWMDIKKQIAEDLMMATRSFVRIGYNLRKIEEQKLYQQDGFEKIAEFAKHEYGLEASTVSRFIAINKRFSIDGYSDRLKPEYACIRSSVLSEMLALPEGDLQMVTPDTPREAVRELKKFNRTSPEDGPSDIETLFIEFFRKKKEILDDLADLPGFPDVDEKKISEVVAPSGTNIFRSGFYFVTFTDREIKIKRYGNTPQEMSYSEFAGMVDSIFALSAAGTWERFYGGTEDEPERIDISGIEADESDESTAQSDKCTAQGDGSPEQEARNPGGRADQLEEPDVQHQAENGNSGEGAAGEPEIHAGPEPGTGGTEEPRNEPEPAPAEGFSAIAPAQFGEEKEPEDELTDEEEQAKVSTELEEIMEKLLSQTDQLRKMIITGEWESAELKIYAIQNGIRRAKELQEIERIS